MQKELQKIQKELKKKLGKKTLEKRRILVKQQITNSETMEMIWAPQKIQQKSFEGTNKPGKYLAYQLKKKRESRIISKISEGGKEIVDKNRIKNTFLKFYSKLYKNDIDLEKLQKFIRE